MGCPLSRPANHPLLIFIINSSPCLWEGGGTGPGEEDRPEEGVLPPGPNSLARVSCMTTSPNKGYMKPGAPPRVGPRGFWGTGGLKAEPGGLRPARLGPDGKRGGELSNGFNASNGMRLVLPSGDVINVPGGLCAKIDRWGGVVYRVENKDVALRLVAGLLYSISRGKGSIVYLNARKIATLLGLRGHLDAFSVSMLYGFLAMLGFEVVEQPRGKAAIINMRHPLIEKIKAVKSIDEAIQVIRKHLGE